MVNSRTVFAAAAALATGANADFRIYYGADVAWGGGDQSSASPALWFMPGDAEPSCEDLETNRARKILGSLTGDLTQTGGFVCDGCDPGSAMEDWTIERLEFEDSEEFPMTTAHPGVITLYHSDEENVFDMVYFDGAGGEMIGSGGRCRQLKSDHADTVTCLHLGSWSAEHFMTCEGIDVAA